MTGRILVVTLNPAVDVTYVVSGVDWAGVNRPVDVLTRPGGKGLNVAFTLRALGADVTVAGLVGGSTGTAIKAAVSVRDIKDGLTVIAGETRRTVTVVDSQRAQVAVFNEPGPTITPAELVAFGADYAAALAGVEIVVLTGSLPPGAGPEEYATLIDSAAQAGVPAVVDAGGDVLRRAAAARPAIVKPNLAELEAAAGQPLRDKAGRADLAAVSAAAHELLADGAQAVVVSLGADGLLALSGDRCWHLGAADVAVSNPTGAGDAVVAGLALGLVRGWTWPDRLRHAAALGAATAVTPVAGEFDRALYGRLASDGPVPTVVGS